MHEKDKVNLQTKFNTTYYLTKYERPYSDYAGLLELQTKYCVPYYGNSYLNDRAACTFTEAFANVEKENLAESISKSRYYSVLNDGSTELSIKDGHERHPSFQTINYFLVKLYYLYHKKAIKGFDCCKSLLRKKGFRHALDRSQNITQ